jgi:hypothetical protein
VDPPVGMLLPPSFFIMLLLKCYVTSLFRSGVACYVARLYIYVTVVRWKLPHSMKWGLSFTRAFNAKVNLDYVDEPANHSIPVSTAPLPPASLDFTPLSARIGVRPLGVIGADQNKIFNATRTLRRAPDRVVICPW